MPRSSCSGYFAASSRTLPARLEKLGLSHLPPAVAAAQYHYLSNWIGGVSSNTCARPTARPGFAIRRRAGEIMILRRRHRRRQVAQAQLLQPGQEAFLLLAAKYPEHELRGI